MTSLELLAPARNADIGIAAIRCGADAVYIGGPAFGARAAAGNSIDDIRRLCDFAKPYGVRIYVTVNTLARDEDERRKVVDLILSLRGTGVSAFILQDTALLPLLASYGPWKEEFHASTQCTIITEARAQELAAMGFKRLIPERQLSFAQIRRIREALPSQVDLECFVHGALCISYSGACYLSEALTGRSANRGECAQPCRSRYDLMISRSIAGRQRRQTETASNDGCTRAEQWEPAEGPDGRGILDRPLLSLKDLRLIDRLAELADAGAVSFKIEGRLKNESYVKNVVLAYSQALDKMIARQPGRWCRASMGRTSGGFTPNLDKTFNRGYTELYADGRRGHWNSGDATKGVGEYLGRWQWVRRNEGKGGCGKLKAGVHNGDGLCFAARGGEIIGFRADSVEALKGGDCLVSCKDVHGLKDGDVIWRNRDNAFEKELENNMPQRNIGVTVNVNIERPPSLKDRLTSLQGRDDRVSLLISAIREDGARLDISFPTEAPAAENVPRMQNLIAGQLSKHSGICDFHVGDISVNAPMPLLSAAQLNEMRRTLADRLVSLPVIQDVAAHTAASGASRNSATDSSCEKSSASQHGIRPQPLMRSKYCILHELGLCRKSEAGKALADKQLALRNNGRIIPLHFNCHLCEMELTSCLQIR